MLSVSKRKLGISSDEIVEILDLRNSFEKVEKIVDHKKYYPGWHMNKKVLVYHHFRWVYFFKRYI